MPYTLGAEDLPDYVKNKPEDMQKKWIGIFNDIAAEEGEEMAFIVANSWLKRELDKYKQYVARAENAMVRIPFELQTDKDYIVRSEGGSEFVSFKLADIMKDSLGVQLNEDTLKEWADRINNGEVVIGDVDHQTWNYYAQQAIPDDEFDTNIRYKPGIAKAVKAIVDKGRLWVKAMIDKKYKSVIEKAKGVSMEAVAKRNPETNELLGADLLGFTFAVGSDPVISGTEVYT